METSTISKKSSESDFRQRISNRKALSIDFGQNSVHIYDASSDKDLSMSPEQLLKLLNNNQYTDRAILVEDAHMGIPQSETLDKGFSFAQYYDINELDTFYKQCEKTNNILRFFPQKLAPRALAYAGYTTKDDAENARANFEYVLGNPKQTLKKPTNLFKKNFRQEEGYQLKNILNWKINQGRGKINPENKKSYHDQFGKWIDDHFYDMYNSFTEETKNIFEIKVYAKTDKTRGFTKGDPKLKKIKKSSLYPILMVFLGKLSKSQNGMPEITNDIVTRQKYPNQLIGWAFTKEHLFNFKASHERGGVARSNFFHHGIRNYTRKKAEEEGYDFEQKYFDTDGTKKNIPHIITYLDKNDPHACSHFFTDKDQTKPVILKVKAGARDCYVRHRNTYIAAIKEAFFLFKSIIEKERGLV